MGPAASILPWSSWKCSSVSCRFHRPLRKAWISRIWFLPFSIFLIGIWMWLGYCKGGVSSDTPHLLLGFLLYCCISITHTTSETSSDAKRFQTRSPRTLQISASLDTLEPVSANLRICETSDLPACSLGGVAYFASSERSMK